MHAAPPPAAPRPSLDCAFAGRCGGCPWIHRTLADQRQAKLEALRGRWTAAGLEPSALDGLALTDVGPSGQRDRMDASLRTAEGGVVMGLYDVNHQDLVDVDRCPQQSAALAPAWAALRADPPPLARASLRLRVGPDGAWGLWIDAANADIGALLDEGDWLRRAAGRFEIAIGQRHKALLLDRPRPRLGPPVLGRWFDSALPGATPERVPLYGPVGGFSQPGMSSNAALVAEVARLAALTGARRWLELGAGNGNLSSALLRRGAEVVAVEPDPLASAGLERMAQDQGWTDRLRLAPASLARDDAALRALISESEAILVDPPRSGMGALPAALSSTPGPSWLLSVSCHADSFVDDLAALIAGGWSLRASAGIDQFPQSPHAEWLALLWRPAAVPR
jgi:23S rRNA (uracil1939-C5)-methyltransferase